ncbi:MAG: molybdopterin-dependent oxidoreductase [Myxococcota bacterium]
MTTWHPTACILCSENCGIEVKLDGRRFAAIRGDKAHPHSKGYLCQKASRLDAYQNHTDRLQSPLARQPDGSFKPVDWDTAIREIAAKMKSIKAEYGGKTFAYYGGGGQGNHLGGVYSSALRGALGTPYIYTALAQEKTGDFWVNGKLFGKQTCHITSDVEHADLVLFVGTNPWQSHGFARARKVLKDIQKDPDRMMIVIDPRVTETAKMADLHLQVRPGGDAHLLAGMLAFIVQEGMHDEAFLAEHCADVDPVLSVLRDIDVGVFARRAGVPVADLRQAALAVAKANSACVRADLGIQQSRHSTLNSWLEKLTFLITGNLGKKGGNHFHTFLLPLIGHSPDPSDPKAVRTAVTGMHPISKLYPPNVLPQEIDTDHPDRIRAMVVDSANPLVSAADTQAYESAFKKLELLVVIDVALTETAQLADYVLPASSQFEKVEATFFNLSFPDNTFHLRRPLLKPLPNTLPEPEIYRRLCVALGAMPDRFPVLERLAKLDRGARRFRLFPMALKARLALQPSLVPLASLVLYATLGRALPEGLDSAAVLWTGAQMLAEKHPDAVRRAGVVDDGSGLGEALFDAILEGQSGTVMTHHRYDDTWSFLRHPDKKVHLDIPDLMPELRALAEEDESAAAPFLLMAGERRSYNANTILRDPLWRKTDPEGALRIHPQDATRLGVGDGDRVRVQSSRGEVEVTVECFDGMQPGVVSLPHGYGMSHPDDDGTRVQYGPWINRLTDAAHCDPHTKTPFHKGVPVQVVPA